MVLACEGWAASCGVVQAVHAVGSKLGESGSRSALPSVCSSLEGWPVRGVSRKPPLKGCVGTRAHIPYPALSAAPLLLLPIQPCHVSSSHMLGWLEVVWRSDSGSWKQPAIASPIQWKFRAGWARQLTESLNLNSGGSGLTPGRGIGHAISSWSPLKL